MIEYIEELKKCITGLSRDDIESMLGYIEKTVLEDGKIYIIGNGGSASTASHLSCDLFKTVNQIAGHYVNAVSLSDNQSLLTAYGNDIAFDYIFSKQLEGRITTKDLIIILSASGDSENLVKAAEYFRTISTNSVAIVGDFHGRVISLASFSIIIPSQNYGIIEDMHLIINHIITQELKKRC